MNWKGFLMITKRNVKMKVVKEEIEEIKKWINEREGLTKHAGIYSEHKKSH